MSNTKISAFPLVLNNDINQFSAIAGVGNAVGGATGVNIGMSGASLINSLEAQLNLSSFSSGTLSVVRGGTGANTFT